jgi:hypothetical protein
LAVEVAVGKTAQPQIAARQAGNNGNFEAERPFFDITDLEKIWDARYNRS